MEAGQTIRGGRYELLEIAGRGGMAVVWRGLQHGDVGFQRTVAVKQMHEHLSNSSLYINMFAEEARVAAAFQSPNIAQVYDFVEENGQYYLILEWIEGIDLGSLIRYHLQQKRSMPWEMAAAVGVGVLRALADAHERYDQEGKPSPILHRDISPHNVLITTRGMVKLIDFGLCLAEDRRQNLTEPGVVKGKMAYLCPEVLSGQRPTVMADQFAVGSVLWESLTCTRLFDGQNDFEIFTKIRDGQIPPIRSLRRDLPRSFVALLNKALATDPSKRFDDARAMQAELSTILQGARSATRDLHDLIGRTVLVARGQLDMGRRTGEPSTTTPIADSVIEQVTLPDTEEAADGEFSGGRTGPISITELTVDEVEHNVARTKQKGLLHRLPFFGKRAN